ncbi:MAG TPA: DedA family protein [Terriglobales bacterium]|jgi:membrane-associated protein|nr:DedA family protein [Terriglobales bacterium]
MGSWLFQVLADHFREWGYWTVPAVLLLENAGIPVPGETVLLFASFLAYDEGELRLPYLILLGIAACTLGDNLGYLLGYRGGRRLLERYQHIFRIRDRTIRRGERLFARHGSVTIFFARFIFGMRIIAGPLAGVLRMPWRQFVIFNFLGATVWVTTISLVGYFFGSEWDTLVKVMGRVNLIIAIVALAVLLFILHRYRERVADKEG